MVVVTRASFFFVYGKGRAQPSTAQVQLNCSGSTQPSDQPMRSERVSRLQLNYILSNGHYVSLRPSFDEVRIVTDILAA